MFFDAQYAAYTVCASGFLEYSLLLTSQAIFVQKYELHHTIYIIYKVQSMTVLMRMTEYVRRARARQTQYKSSA